MSVGRSVRLSFFRRYGVTAPAQLLESLFYHCPCPPARDLSSRVSGLVIFSNYFGLGHLASWRSSLGHLASPSSGYEESQRRVVPSTVPGAANGKSRPQRPGYTASRYSITLGTREVPPLWLFCVPAP